MKDNKATSNLLRSVVDAHEAMEDALNAAFDVAEPEVVQWMRDNKCKVYDSINDEYNAIDLAAAAMRHFGLDEADDYGNVWLTDQFEAWAVDVAG